MPEDYYALLGVEPDASKEAILRAYRQKAAEHHPDVSDEPGANETFRQLNRAKRVLTDEARRREYDRLGHEGYVDGEDGRSNPPRSDPPSTADEPSEWTGARPSGMASLFATLFGPSFGTSASAASADYTAPGGRRLRWSGPFTIDLESLFEAVASHDTAGPAGVAATRRSSGAGGAREDCPKCRGRGTFVHDIDTARGRTRRLEPCERCGGTGSVRT